MPPVTLAELLERNERHVAALPEDHFAAVINEQRPRVVSICCSDSRVPQAGMWSVEKAGWLFTPSTIGNQVQDTFGGKQVVDGSVVYPLQHTDTSVVVVVGHTGCGAIAAALSYVQTGTISVAPGIEKWVTSLAPIVQDGLEDDRIDVDGELPVIDQLVEYNVDRQIQFLLDSDDIDEQTTVYGFVYDFKGTYGDDRGRAYLTNVNGNTDIDELRSLVGDTYQHAVVRII